MNNSIKRILITAAIGLGLVLAPATGAQASEPIVTLNSTSVASPMFICGYPDNPDGTCGWWPNALACHAIAVDGGADWQRYKCAVAGFTGR